MGQDVIRKRLESSTWRELSIRQREPCPTEEVEQTCLFRWAAYASGAYPELRMLHAIPNGGKRGKAEAGRMKAAGVKAGVPDMCLPVARHGCHGLYIELKRASGGRVSKEQVAWMDALTRQGYRCALCRGWNEARKVIEEYLTVEEAHKSESAEDQEGMPEGRDCAGGDADARRDDGLQPCGAVGGHA